MPFKTTTKATTVYKAVRHPETNEPLIAVLSLPKGTVYYELSERMKRKHAWNRKCRAERAKVVRIESRLSARKRTDKLIPVSDWDSDFTYPCGKIVRPNAPFSRATMQCASGIHFFFAREDAAGYLV